MLEQNKIKFIKASYFFKIRILIYGENNFIITSVYQ